MNKPGIKPKPVFAYQKVRIYTESGRVQIVRRQVMLTEKAADEYNNLNIEGERDTEPCIIKFQRCNVR